MTAWIQTSERLPRLEECELGDWCKESRMVLIKLHKDAGVHLAHYRVHYEDGVVDPSTEPTWVLDGRDGYTLDPKRVAKWCDIPE